MVIIRNTFRLKFGAAKEAKALIPEIKAINAKHGTTNIRALTDLTGESYTLILEFGYPSLAEFETKIQKMFTDPEWSKLYEKFCQFIESGSREIFTVVGE